MRTILIAIGSRGDVFPFLGFGKALRELGMAVSVITSGNFKRDVNEAGLDYLELFDAQTYETVRDAVETWQAKTKRRLDQETWDLILSLAHERLFGIIEGNYVAGETVLGTSQLFTFAGAQVAWARLGVPYAALWHGVEMFKAFQPYLPSAMRGFEDGLRERILSIFPEFRMVKRRFNQFRSSLGLPAESNLMRAAFYDQQLNIGLFPNWYVPWFHGRLENTVLTHFPLFERGQGEPLPADLEAFLNAGTPPVVFGNASWRKNLDEYFEASVAACESLGVRGVLLSDRAHKFAERNSNFFCIDYVSLEGLLPRAAALVHHGGIGTLSRALAEATPQLVVPYNGDQHLNARDIVKLGAGLSIKVRKYNELVLPTLGRLLGSDEIRANCASLSERFQQPDFSEAANRLERLAKGAPVAMNPSEV